MKSAFLAAAPLFLLGLSGGPLPLRAADCVQRSELSLGGVPLGAGRRDVLKRLGRPLGQWEERLDRHLDHLVYPGLEARIGRQGTVESLAARSSRYGSPSGVRVGQSWEEVRAILGLAPYPELQPGIPFAINLCKASEPDAFMTLAFDRGFRFARIEVQVYPPDEFTGSFADRHEEEARSEPFPWSKGPLEYLAMLQEHSRRAHLVKSPAPPGWVKESDLPALVAALKDGRTCATTQRANEAGVITTHSSVSREARFLIEGFREDAFPPAADSSLMPKESEILAWWAEWLKSQPILPWPAGETGLAVGSTYETDFKFSARWKPVEGTPHPEPAARLEWLNPGDFFPLEGPDGLDDYRTWESWKPIRVTFRVVSREMGGEHEVIYHCLALRVTRNSWRD